MSYYDTPNRASDSGPDERRVVEEDDNDMAYDAWREETEEE